MGDRNNMKKDIIVIFVEDYKQMSKEEFKEYIKQIYQQGYDKGYDKGYEDGNSSLVHYNKTQETTPFTTYRDFINC